MIAQIDKEYLRVRPSKIWNRLISYGLFEGRPITTKGQWINPLVFRNFKFWQNMPQMKDVKSPIFIIGTGRSGTTMLGILFSIHKSVSYLNEPKALWHEIYSKEDIIGSYSNGEAFYCLGVDLITKKIKNKAKKIYGAYLAITGGNRVVDKYPELIFRIPFVKEIFPDARFLFITRNGEDTLQSTENWSKRLGTTEDNEIHDWWGVNGRKWKLLCEQLIPKSRYLKNHQVEISQFQDHKDRATVEWILTMEQGVKMTEEFSESIFQFKYEHVLDDPAVILNEILDFTDLRYDSKMIEYAERVIGEPTSKRTVEIHPILKSSFNELMKKLSYA